MKKVLGLAFMVFLIGVVPCQAVTLLDDFNDGYADGWFAAPPVFGNGKVVEGTFLQDASEVKFLRDTPVLTNQIIETQLKVNGPSGGCGITLWYAGENTFVVVNVAPVLGVIGVAEFITYWHAQAYGADYPTTFPLSHDTWYTLRVNANGTTGELAVYLDDIYQFTYTVNTLYRSGLSGTFTGNAGGYFDNFSLTSPNITKKWVKQCQ